jgi:hypothetical protein
MSFHFCEFPLTWAPHNKVLQGVHDSDVLSLSASAALQEGEFPCSAVQPGAASLVYCLLSIDMGSGGLGFGFRSALALTVECRLTEVEVVM